MAKITIYVPDQEPMKVSFDQEFVTLGRAPDNDLVVAHESISGHHAKIQREGDSYIVVDLDSTNGIKVEDVPTTKGPLSNGTKITFGRVDAVYECEETAAAEDEKEDDAEASVGGGDGEPFVSNMEVELAETSTKPEGFDNLSPLEKAVDKNQLGKAAMAIGLIAILSALATFGLAASMKVG
ncbi:MAG: FHA domain-containing protein [Verrucomicrobia bacterium]|nr:FHA domain-containing protein [Verrucomicrobiota bacterium]